MIKAARFQWGGSPGTVIPLVPDKTGEHALIAFTQENFGAISVPGCSGNPYDPGLTNYVNDPVHSSKNLHPQYLWKYGAGVLLSPKGLGLELWNGNGTAYKWDQTIAPPPGVSGSSCAELVPSGNRVGLCLGTNPSASAHLTTLNGFSLTRGAYYWLRLTLTGNPNGQNGWTRLSAELFEQTAQGSFLLQLGQMDFVTAQFFPSPGIIESTIARTGSNDADFSYAVDDIQFWAFDFGF